jgi:uncharacterized protein
MLLAEGADPNVRSPDGEGTPLCAAACHGEAEIVRELLSHGADPDLKEDEWFTPLRWAASNGHEQALRVLLEYGADPDAGSPLAAGARRGSVGVVRALLEGGADPARADYDGRTALAIAEEWAARDIEDALADRVLALAASSGGEGPDGAEVMRRREPVADGTELVTVEARFPDGSRLGADLQTGHAAIAALLRSHPGPHAA